jgi:hypothetical protein
MRKWEFFNENKLPENLFLPFKNYINNLNKLKIK